MQPSATPTPNPPARELHLQLVDMPKPAHMSTSDYLMSVNYLCQYYSDPQDQYFRFEGIQFYGCAATLIHQYLKENPSKKIVTWLQDHASTPAVNR